MKTTSSQNEFPGDAIYKRRILAWTMYDWANSAFATTIMAAILPIYYSQVAAVTLPSAAKATAYWSAGISLSTLFIAILSPILGTISDVMRGKKLFLSIFWGLGIVTTGLLVLVSTGDWMLASLLFILGRIGFSGANVFYDALLPHVAQEKDVNLVSSRGYAMGYLGGGLLLAINVIMIKFLPGTWGARFSFLSVALWWGVFSIPLFRLVPEPPAASVHTKKSGEILRISFIRLRQTFRDIRQYRELSLYTLAFLIYVDGIGTIIEMAAIYGAELGLGSTELILALLLVQFVGIPFSLIFGNLPNPSAKMRSAFLAFTVYNIIALPLAGISSRSFLPAHIIGSAPKPYAATVSAVGQGIYQAGGAEIHYTGEWKTQSIPAKELGSAQNASYLLSEQTQSSYALSFNGQEIEITYSLDPHNGIWLVEMDGQPLLDAETNKPLMIDGYSPTIRHEVQQILSADLPGEHELRLVNTETKNPNSQGNNMSLWQIRVLPPLRQSNLGMILGIILATEALGLVFAFLFGKKIFAHLSYHLDTKGSILLALAVYAIASIWGFFLMSVVEYWFLAWMIATVQGGSQALSRSLFSTMAPASKSGEFFSLFGVMEKFSAILGPAIFALVATRFNSSRPAILSIVAFFIVGSLVLSKVNVEKGRQVAQAEDAAAVVEG